MKNDSQDAAEKKGMRMFFISFGIVFILLFVIMFSSFWAKMEVESEYQELHSKITPFPIEF